MKEYKKPTIQIVNLKSSDDIAVASYKDLQGQFINQYLNSTSISNRKSYAITRYNLQTSGTSPQSESQ